MSESYETVGKPGHFEQLIKKSRFVGRCQSVATDEDAVAFVRTIADAGASHNCWAYKIGQACRFHDDGEPGGTAGQPIMNAIEGAALDRVAVIVTRYYGGVKLGAGGLVRAYRSTAASCLLAAGTATVYGKTQLIAQLPFALIGMVHRLADKHNGTVASEHFGAEGVTICVELNDHARHRFQLEATELSSGRCKFIEKPNIMT